MNIYLDTISIYHDYPKKDFIQLNPSSNWQKQTEHKGKQDVTCWWIHDNNITIRVYNCIFGVARIFITCSIPKVTHNNNYWYISGSEISAFISTVEAMLAKHILFPTSIDILFFQLSRADLFYMHLVPPELKEMTLDALGKMGSGRYKQTRYINTRYLCCKLLFEETPEGKVRLASVIVRVYDKDLEQFNQYYPESLHEDFKYHQYAEFIPPNYIRLEVAMMRDKIVKRLGNNNRDDDSPTTLASLLLRPALQVEILDEYFKTLGFYDRVYSAPAFRKAVAEIAPTKKTYNNAKDVARLLRNSKNINISPDALRSVHELLRANGISIITTSKHDLPPIERNSLLAQDAVFVKAPAIQMID